MTPTLVPAPSLRNLKGDLDCRFSALAGTLDGMTDEQLSDMVDRILALHVPEEMTADALRDVRAAL